MLAWKKYVKTANKKDVVNVRYAAVMRRGGEENLVGLMRGRY